MWPPSRYFSFLLKYITNQIFNNYYQLNDPLTIDDTDYYVLAKPAATTFTVKETLAGTIATLSDGTGLAAVRKLSASTYIGGVTAVASTGIFTGTTAFVANLVIGNPVVINNAQYWYIFKFTIYLSITTNTIL